MTLVEIGCAVDLDLSFAQPEISTQIQDRSTNGVDGTASSTGVTQVTKIEAVNTNKLSVGGTTPLVGIGLAAGVTPLRKLHINDASEADILLTRTAGVADSASLLGSLYFGNQDVDQYLCCIQAIQDGAKDAGRLEFSTEATGGTRATRLTIDSAGKVGIGRAPANVFEVHIDTDKNIGFSGDQGEVGNVPALVAYNDSGSALASLGFRGAALRFATGSAERLTIDAAGLASFSNGTHVNGGESQTMTTDGTVTSFKFMGQYSTAGGTAATTHDVLFTTITGEADANRTYYATIKTAWYGNSETASGQFEYIGYGSNAFGSYYDIRTIATGGDTGCSVGVSGISNGLRFTSTKDSSVAAPVFFIIELHRLS